MVQRIWQKPSGLIAPRLKYNQPSPRT